MNQGSGMRSRPVSDIMFWIEVQDMAVTVTLVKLGVGVWHMQGLELR